MPQDPVEDLDERREEMDHADKFPFLRLPNELIDKTLSFASMKDRMNVRVCKRLHKIEAETKCYIEDLRIINENYSQREEEGAQYIICDASFSRDFMRFLDRVSNNTSVGTLYIEISLRHGFPSQIVNEFCNIITKFDAKNVKFGAVSMTRVLPERFMIDIAAKCYTLHLFSQVPYDAAELHEIYKGMVDGSLKLTELYYFLFPLALRNFIELIGIFYVDGGEFFSNRDIELYSLGWSNSFGGYIFDYCIFDGDLSIEYGQLGPFKMVRHKTPESLEEAKNAVRNKEGMVRRIVAPIEE